MKALTGAGSGPILAFALQQIHEFLALGEDFAMQYSGTEYLGEWNEELKTAVLELIPPEERLRGLSPEERLRGLSPEERLRGLSPEERIRGLSDEELDRLRELLEQRRDG
jgi:hypothetical protein